jgi:hypothetical protein
MERAAISDNDDGEGKGRAKEQHENLQYNEIRSP